jgi:hypothetical protein
MRLLKSIGAGFLMLFPTTFVLQVILTLLSGTSGELSTPVYSFFWIVWSVVFYKWVFKPPAIEKDVSVFPKK